jgi:hypothetical protein
MNTNSKKSPSQRKVIKPQAPAPAPQQAQPAPISATLSRQASALVRWYCGVTRHQESAAVEGAVFGVMERAWSAYQDDNRHDESFNWLLEDVLDGMNNDARQPVCAMHGGGYTMRLSIRASALLSRWQEKSGDDPRDIVSGAVESMLACALDDADLSLCGAIKKAREQRLADEAATQRQDEALAAYLARKEAA